MKKMWLIALLTSLALLTAFTACNSAVNQSTQNGEEEMAFVLQLPASNSRAAYYTQDDATSYKVELHKAGSVIKSVTGLPGEKVRFVVTEEGSYTIKVTAYKDNTVIAEATKDASISLSDGDIDIKITMVPKHKETGVNIDIQWPSDTVSYIGTKAPDVEKEVGDIVFNDGSATPYTAGMTFNKVQKSAAIALIFYKGKGLNSGDDTTTRRTLGVGLKHNKSGIAWCRYNGDSDYANAYNTKITTIQCSEGGSPGALTFTGDKNVSDNLEQMAAFLSAATGVTDDTSTVANYPDFYFGKNYKNVTGSNVKGSAYENGWYLPSIAELFQIYTCRENKTKGFDVDTASEALGGDKFGTAGYWSSSQYSSGVDFAFVLAFNEGDWYASFKNKESSQVCCIREFN